MLYYQYFLMNLSLCLRVQRYNLFSKLPNLFQKIFFRFIFSLAIFAGAKVQPFFQLTKSFFKNFFSLFFELHSLFESGCKITTFFRTTKTFFKKNFVYFNEPAPFSKAGAKVQQLFELTKYFKEFF